MAASDHFFQLRSLPGTAWPAVPYPQMSLVWNAYQAIERTQWLGAAEIETMQLRQVNALLAHARRNVPYYAKLFADAGIADRPIESLEEFRKIPLLTRDLYQANFGTIQAKELPDGMMAVGKGSFTSGTSGVPIKALKTNRDALWWNALFLRDLEWSSIDPRGRLASIRLFAYKPETLPEAMAGTSMPHWNRLLQTLIDSGPCFGMEIRQDPRRQLEWLREVKPTCLLSMPTNLQFLAGLVRNSGQPLRELKTIQAVGEPLSPEVKREIEAGFGVPVKNLYSTTEGGYIASECPAGHGMHVHAENVMCEVLDERGNPCKLGQTGRLIFTNLHGFLTPFIRYEIHDEVTLAPGPCPCGRGLPLWSNIDGRKYPSVHLADGRRKSSIGIVLGLRQVGGMHQFQIIQREVNHAIVRVVPDRTWTPEHADRIRDVLHREFGSPIRVDIEEKPFVERPPGGKLRLVVVEMG